MLGAAEKTRSSAQDADNNVSIVEISDAETFNSTTKSEDQTFVGHANTSTKLSGEKATAVIPAAPNGAAKVLFFDGIRGLAAIQRNIPRTNFTSGQWLWTHYLCCHLTAIVLSCVSTENQQNFNVSKPEDYDLGNVLLFYTGYRFHVFWTLPLEIGYYFVLPVFVAIVLGLRRFWWHGAVPLSVWIAQEGFYAYRNHHMPLAPHLHTFIMGSLGAVVFVKSDLWIKETRFTFRWGHTLVLRVVEGLAIALMLGGGCFDGLFFDWIHEDPVPAGPGFPFVSAQMTAIFVIEMIRPSCISTMFEWSVLRYWGKISFSVYLLHCFIIYHPSIMHEKKDFNRFFARFGLALLLATASYHLIERPSQLLAQKISRFLTAQDGKDFGTCLVRFTCIERTNLRRQRVPVEEK
ncbi:hypothetical protein Pcac1_g8373 [Phytophthora cactorum]|nr:hypothetical protein GQ600_1593 [Phytophthora cactorum]KAG2782019.1 hypothetical protein Pcac1_g8373 [Phytophthora cactorum]KAG2819659.1 hypothetical protein PC111_g11792 [Phytophthora cactorum]KAG3018554.1 hypothetical protein PC120_g10368 [Phytophthora cactorum]KAG3150034.1 hypothetical protein C6341_g16877 [Phytophthora cactorum]